MAVVDRTLHSPPITEERMRGEAEEPEAIFSYITPSQRVPQDHPLRGVRKVVDAALERMSPRFQRLYSRIGRPSIPPERLIRALLLQVLYTIRSERQLIEHLDFNILFRWFVGLGLDDPVWDATTFTKNRDRLLQGEWAGIKSFKRKEVKDQEPPDGPRNPTVNFHKEERTNETHQSTTDPDSRFLRKGKGKEAKLCFMGHVVMENRNGLVVGGRVTRATGTTETKEALGLLEDIPRKHRITVGGDKGFDTGAFIEGLRAQQATPHVAQNTNNRSSAIDQGTTRHSGYEVSQRKRKRIE